MSEGAVYEVSESTSSSAWIDESGYFSMYAASVSDPEAFWGEHGKRIEWFTPYSQVKDVSYGPGDVHIQWYADGTTNVAHNCIDRHLADKRDTTAIIWEGDDPADSKHITYGELHEQVCRLGNALKGQEGSRRATGSPSTCR